MTIQQRKSGSRKTLGILLIGIFIIITLSGCVGQQDNPDNTTSTTTFSTTPPSSTNPPSTTTTTATTIEPIATIQGFDFTLETDTFWHFYWTSEYTSFVQGSGSSGDTYTGNFYMILGDPVEISGILAYPIEITGESVDPEAFDYTPHWKSTTHSLLFRVRFTGDASYFQEAYVLVGLFGIQVSARAFIATYLLHP